VLRNVVDMLSFSWLATQYAILSVCPGLLLMTPLTVTARHNGFGKDIWRNPIEDTDQVLKVSQHLPIMSPLTGSDLLHRRCPLCGRSCHHKSRLRCLLPPTLPNERLSQDRLPSACGHHHPRHALQLSLRLPMLAYFLCMDIMERRD
jgi:hypothetical protein